MGRLDNTFVTCTCPEQVIFSIKVDKVAVVKIVEVNF
jgi:hypothetical protein